MFPDLVGKLILTRKVSLSAKKTEVGSCEVLVSPPTGRDCSEWGVWRALVRIEHLAAPRAVLAKASDVPLEAVFTFLVTANTWIDRGNAV